MKSNENFWFWVFAIAPFAAALLMTTTHQLNLGSGWFLALFYAVTLVSVGGMAYLLIVNRGKARAHLTTRLQERETNKSNSGSLVQAAKISTQRMNYLVRAVCIGGILLLEGLASLGAFPRLLIGWLEFGLFATLLWSFLVAREQ